MIEKIKKKKNTEKTKSSATTTQKILQKRPRARKEDR